VVIAKSKNILRGTGQRPTHYAFRPHGVLWVVTVEFACSCETNVDYKNIKGKSDKNHEKETFHQKLELSQ
jgi:hypothetical protein